MTCQTAAHEDEDIVTHIAGGVARVTLNRPNSLNALGVKSYRELTDAFARLSLDDDIGAIILEANGRAFSSGGDLNEVAAHQRNAETGERDVKALIDSYEACFFQIEQCDQVVVACVNGLAYAGGLILVLCCDLSIAAASATFRVPELEAGLSDPFVPVRLPQRVGMELAKNMVFSGRDVSADEAAKFGLVSRVVPDDQLEEEGLKLAECVARAPAHARRAYKSQFARMLPPFNTRGHLSAFFSPSAIRGMERFRGGSEHGD